MIILNFGKSFGGGNPEYVWARIYILGIWTPFVLKAKWENVK